ncbi:YozQ family protein [Halobacillus sp. B23F22_1]|uniref:YozQ family protein n=1 Tax=Halobacillus sp. B23F22_1 TaxID=3459514 RepID=UPI00373F29FA
MEKEERKSIGDRKYEAADYQREDETSKGLATTHEQVSDTLTEGTYDAEVDQVDKDGHLVSHKGKELNKRK